MLSDADRNKAADILMTAEKERKQAVQLSTTWPDITIEDAYAISTEVRQAQDRGRRKADRPQGRPDLEGDAAFLADRRAGLRLPARRHDDRRRRKDAARRTTAGRGSRSSLPSCSARR